MRVWAKTLEMGSSPRSGAVRTIQCLGLSAIKEGEERYQVITKEHNRSIKTSAQLRGLVHRSPHNSDLSLKAPNRRVLEPKSGRLGFVLVLALYNSAHASLAIRYRYAHSWRVSRGIHIESAGLRGVMRGGRW